MGAARQLGDHPPELGVQVDLARHHRRAHHEAVVDHRGSRLVARGLDGQHQPCHGASARASATSAREIAPTRSTSGSRPHTLTSVEGTSRSRPPSTSRSTAGPRLAATSSAVPRRRRAVGVGAGHHEDAGPLEEPPEERVIGDAHRHLVAAVQPGRPSGVVGEPEGEGQGSGPPPAGQDLGGGRERHPEVEHLGAGGGEDREVHPLGPVLGPEDGAHGVGLPRSGGQAVHRVGRDDGNAAGGQDLGGGPRPLGIGLHPSHGRSTGPAARRRPTLRG